MQEFMRKYCHQTKRPSVSALFVCIDFGRNDSSQKLTETTHLPRSKRPTQKLAETTQAETTQRRNDPDS